jgi:CDP-glucose 4,6-dehydratase
MGARQGTLESLVGPMHFADTYCGKRVLLTGHTGFKGSWLAEWLLSLGAEVTGLALEPNTQPALFDELKLAGRIEHHIGDIRDPGLVSRLVEKTQPHFVFHLAAQPLVRLSYAQSVDTFATNVMGTVHVMEAVRMAARPCTVLCISTDKCYDNREWVHSYREVDPLGGHDPYSASKGAAEIAIGSYRRSFFSAADTIVHLASARAGNVIGGGDWALDRIMPDCIRALARGESIAVRNKVATRPWQHVLEPLSGYLHLAASIHQAAEKKAPELNQLCSAFNFGPALSSNRSVADVVNEALKHWPGTWEDKSDPHAVHEATLLNLATDKAKHLLRWQPVWNFEQTVARTVEWYHQNHLNPSGAPSLTAQQITDFTAAATVAGLPWAT